jgi:hypothetical protein
MARNHRNPLRLQRAQRMNERPGAGDDRRGRAFLRRHLVQALLRLTVIALAHAHDGHEARIAEHVDARIG